MVTTRAGLHSVLVVGLAPSPVARMSAPTGGGHLTPWRARDIEGDEVFLLLCDDCGPHPASGVAL